MGGCVVTTSPDELRQSYQTQLEGAGVPVNLAAQCAEIIATDDATKPDLGRSVDDQHLIDSSMEWLKAKGHFER
jgi:hypothetical protein